MKKIEYGPGWEERALIRAKWRKRGGAPADLQTQAETETELLAACGASCAERTGIGRVIRGWTDRVAGRR